MVTVDVFPAKLLTPDLQRRWSEIQESNPELQSPFFCPEFTCDVAEVRDDVEVGVLRDGSEPIGFFPYQRGPHGRGIPVGGVLSDLQGIVLAPQQVVDPAKLIRDCGLSSWRFHSVLGSQQAFRPFHWDSGDFPVMDLCGGFDVYRQSRREAGSTMASRIIDKAKKAARDVGPVRFEAHSDEPHVLQALVEWKSRHYERIHSENYLTKSWTLALVDRLLARRGEEFAGVLSSVHLGDHLVAVHLGMRYRGVLHAWFPTYCEEFGKYSPGMILFLELAKAAESMGIQRIDLGRGSERFKTSLASGAIPVAEGGVGLGLAARSARQMYLRAHRWIESSRFHQPVRAAYRRVRSFLGRRRAKSGRTQS